MTSDRAKPINGADSDRPQPIDIARRLRQTRANMLGTDDEQHYWDCHDAAAEIERLRLTDAEREAICYALTALAGQMPDDQRATLAALLERTANRDTTKPRNGAVDTPETHATPGECSTPKQCTVPPEWLQRPYLVDPPGGWRYGFPKRYDPAADGNMTQWLIANGYPESLAREGVVCTFTSARNEE